MADTVKSWKNGTLDNYGIYLKGSVVQGYAHERDARYFWSFCGAVFPYNKPYLVIEYDQPNSAPNTPSVSVDGVTANWQWKNFTTATIRWNFSDPDSGDYQTKVRIRGYNQGGGPVVFDTGEMNTSGTSYNYVNIPEGDWQFSVTVCDRYGAWSPVGWSPWFHVDRTKPTIGSVSGTQYTNGSSAVRIWAYNVADNWAGVNRVLVYLTRPDGSFYQIQNAKQSGNNWYVDVSWSSSDQRGVWGVDFYAVDNAGNQSNMKRAGVVFNTIPPNIGSTYPEQVYSNVPVNGTFRIRADNVTDDRNELDKVRFAVWTEAGGQDDIKWYDGVNAGGGIWYYDVPINQHGNAEGKYIIHTYAYDRSGNYSSKGTEKWVDRTPPTNATPQAYSYTNQTSGSYRVWFNGVTDSITGIGGTSASVTKPDGTNTGLTAYASGNNYYVDVPLSTMQGEYTVYFQSQDRAGNRSGTVYAKFFLDSVRANDPNPNVTYTDRSATFTWNAFSDPAPSSGRKTTDFYLGEWNGSSWVGTPLYNGTDIGNVTSFVVNNLKPGTRYRYTVTYHDNAGNESLYTYKEFVTKRIVGYYRVRTAANETTSFPLYDPASGVLGEKSVRISLGGGVAGCFELVPVNDPRAGRLRISTPQGIRAVAK